MSPAQCQFTATGGTVQEVKEQAEAIAAGFFGAGEFIIEELEARPVSQGWAGEVFLWEADVLAVQKNWGPS